MPLPTSLKRLLRRELDPFKVTKAAIALPATSSTAIYTVTGRVKIHFLSAEVTTIIQTQACNLSFDWLSTVGAEVQSLSGILNISAFDVGKIVCAVSPNSVAVAGTCLMSAPGIVSAGSIRITTNATNTGNVKLEVWWSGIRDEAGDLVAA